MRGNRLFRKPADSKLFHELYWVFVFLSDQTDRARIRSRAMSLHKASGLANSKNVG